MKQKPKNINELLGYRGIEILYRYEDSYDCGGFDMDGDWIPGPLSTRVHLAEYTIKKFTPCGAWIRYGTKDKFVNFKTKKKFACITPKEALESFLARKAKQIQILQNQLERATEALEKGKKLAHEEYPGQISIWLSLGRELFKG